MILHVLATSLSIAPSTLHPIVATGRSQTPVLCAIQRESELSEAACLSVCWATLGTLAVAATATRSCVGPPLAVGRSILAGGIAAALGEAMFYPLEVAKMRLQQTGMNRLGLMGELRAILVAESGRSMLLTWASTPGVVAGVLRAVVYHGLRLGLFPPIQHALIALLAGGGTGGVSLGVKILIGAVCGAVAAALTTPLDLVKTRLAVRPDAYPNSIGALVGIARDGARAATSSGATRGPRPLLAPRQLSGLHSLLPSGRVHCGLAAQWPPRSFELLLAPVLNLPAMIRRNAPLPRYSPVAREAPRWPSPWRRWCRPPRT